MKNTNWMDKRGLSHEEREGVLMAIDAIGTCQKHISCAACTGIPNKTCKTCGYYQNSTCPLRVYLSGKGASKAWVVTP